ncbi:hypothetical protein [Alteromonas lipolytica]|uniref:Uncharacterized protein n=1 Tax=Alteromonas lipolytica TaxID=1856405 RepID=A0A1E8FBW7_9ALTE|nr:hypothetical protein [Alteromonas lipolytica]OFI33427.1 hypothetical protein BFC17_03985 [Alteromonas lipolytica]GGF59774.1 hypothetical protein GCM10011338_10030 [Alteromonas lipolytica]
MTTDYLSLEWQTLQNQYDSYEKYSLIIKLVAIVITISGMGLSFEVPVMLAGIAVLWLQDGIWKTFQGRFETRLLAIEAALAANHNQPGCQFNQAYQQNANGGLSLIIEYLKQALRPTVMYPYAVLVLISLSRFWW